MGKKIQIDEHYFELPEPPKSKADVLFADLPKEQQYWRRLKFPKIWYDFIPGITKVNSPATIYNADNVLIHLSADDTKLLSKLLEIELHRRRYGVWMMNCGELEYLTGDHYFALQWGKMHGYTNNEHEGCYYSVNGMAHPDYGSNYGMFRKFQRDVAYFLQLTKNDPLCAGGFIGKAKKTGVTQFMALFYLNESTMIKEKRFAFMSKSHSDAKFTNMMLYQHALEALPPIITPRIKTLNQSKVVFDKPRNSAGLHMAASAGFKTYVEALPTKEDGFDGPKIYCSWLDEFMKYESPYPQIFFDKSSEATKLQHEIVGKQYLTCYPPEDNSRGFYEARKIWKECMLSTKNSEGQTKSGLYKFFLGALNATEGTFDWYGNADQALAYRKNHARRDQAKGDRVALQRLKRQYPEKETEMWEAGGSGSAFDNIRLSEQKKLVEQEEENGAKLFVDGNLEWTGEPYNSPVVWVELSPEQIDAGHVGRFRCFEKLMPDEINRIINEHSIDMYGNYRPTDDAICVTSVDPTDYRQASEAAEGSKNSIICGAVEDTVRNTRFNRIASNIPFFEMLHRDDDPDVLLEDVVKLIFYANSYVLVEANKGWLITKLKKMNLQNFMIIYDKSKKIFRPYKDGDETVSVYTSEHLIDEYCRAIATYIRKVGIGEVEYLKYLKSIRLIDQLMEFDPKDTKKYDLVVSFGYWRLGCTALSYVKSENEGRKGYYDGDAETLLDALDFL